MSESILMKFTLDREDIKKSLSFAEKAVSERNQSKKDFGRGDMPRKKNDQIADIAEGKMAECGFKHFLSENFGIDIELDFRHYPGEKEIDYGNDIEEIVFAGRHLICTYKIDVKATRSYSKWLLIEGHKFWSNAYVLVKTNLPRDYENNPYLFTDRKVETEITGFAYYSDFIDPATKKPWFKYTKGDKLLDPSSIKMKFPPEPFNLKEEIFSQRVRTLNVCLKSEQNYGLPADWLRKEHCEWEKLVNCITSASAERNYIIHP